MLSPVDGGFTVGRIRSGYFWRPDLPPSRPRHCRRAEWLGQITNAQLSADTRQALSSWNSVFSISPGELGHGHLIEVLRQIPDSRPPGLERIVAWNDDRKVAFYGRWLTEWIDPNEDMHHYRAAQTKRGAIAVIDADEGRSRAATGEAAAEVLHVYEDLKAAEKAGVPYPVILAAAEALDVEYVDELDI